MTRVVENIRMVGSAGLWNTGDVAEPDWPGSTDPANRPETVAGAGTRGTEPSARAAWAWAAAGATGGRAGWPVAVLGAQPAGRSFWCRLMVAASAASAAAADSPGALVAVVVVLSLCFLTTK